MSHRITPLFAIAATATLLLVAASARSDVVPADYEAPPPPECPTGSVVRAQHHGAAVCVPSPTCADGQRCPNELVCTPTRFCLAQRSLGRARVEVIVGQCAADGSCAEGTCNIARRCAAPSRSAPNSGGCDVGGRLDTRREWVFAWLSLAALVITVARRRAARD